MDNLSGTWMTTFASRLMPQAAGSGFNSATSAVLSRNDGLASSVAYRLPAIGRPVAIQTDEVIGRTDDEQERAERLARQRVLNQDLFTSALVRERRRADRFEEAFAVVTIDVRAAELPAVVSAMTAATRATDILGWVEQDRVLGVILAEVVKPTDTAAGQIEDRMQRELLRSLPARAASQLEMQWYVHEGPGRDGAEGLAEGDPLLECILESRARRGALDTLKRCLDLVGSGILLLLLFPVFLLVAALVKLTSPGPVLFRQSRVGELAKPFTMLKFRTMHVNNDPALHRAFVTQFINSGARAVASGSDAPFKITNDPRTTSVGRFLRRTSLDELPQLWNVFRGDMSLVGPRPPLRYELDQYRSWHWRRVLEAKPGMTGLWQVTGRSRTTFDEMVRLDLRYVRTRCFWTDIRILLATPRAVIGGKGAC